MATPRFEIIDEQDISEIRPQPRPANQQGQDAAFSALMLALKTMSQKTVVALSRLGSYAALMSVFWLSLTLKTPDINQLVLLGLYALFVLAGIWIIRR